MKLDKILVCPSCKTRLNKKLSCSSCKKNYSFINGKPAFIKPQKTSTDKLLNFFIKNAKWIIPSPSFNVYAKSNIKYIKKRLPKKSKILIIGGGTHKLAKGINNLSEHLENIINLEIVDGPLVDVIGDAHHLPFKNNSFDLVIIQAVLEHVKYPKKVVDEIHRILKKKGFVYAEVPFMQGVHGRPHDFQRYTKYGLETLFEEYKIVKSDILIGPTASIIWVFREYLAILFSFNNKYLYYFFNLVFGWIFFPFKYLDIILIKLKYANNIAGAYYYLGKK